MLLLLTILYTGCVAPSMTIYGIGKNANGKAVAVKEAQIYGDLVGTTVVTGSIVTVSASGGYYNSTVARENWQGMAEFGRSVVQPIVWGIVSGGVAAAAVGDAAGAAVEVAGQ